MTAIDTTLQTSRRRLARRLRLWLALLAGWLVLAGAHAGSEPGELPALVGRFSALQGEVWLLDRDSGGWTASTAAQPLQNWPVAAGDRLRTGADGRADLRIGSTTVRVGAGAELWLQRLDGQALQLQLQAGTIALRLPPVGGDGFGPLEVSTGEGRWLPLRPGSYRLDRQPDATQATAWQGELRFEGRDSALVVPAGRRADLWLDGPGTATPGRTRYAWAEVDHDAFADWVAGEERMEEAPVAASHVSPTMSGWQDLDRYGDWVSDPELGSLWQPRVVVAGWAPYRYGRWAWVVPWGWTWIDAAPWGFAPFHYGSWIVFGGRWSWAPGPRGYRRRYAPVLSGWVSGPALGVGVGVGVQIGGGWRPPPPRVVTPVVVPVIVQRPGRGAVVVNTPLHRPGHGPWQEQPGHERREPDWVSLPRSADRRDGTARAIESRPADVREPGRATQDRAHPERPPPGFPQGSRTVGETAPALPSHRAATPAAHVAPVVPVGTPPATAGRPAAAMPPAAPMTPAVPVKPVAGGPPPHVARDTSVGRPGGDPHRDAADEVGDAGPRRGFQRPDRTTSH